MKVQRKAGGQVDKRPVRHTKYSTRMLLSNLKPSKNSISFVFYNNDPKSLRRDLSPSNMLDLVTISF